MSDASATSRDHEERACRKTRKSLIERLGNWEDQRTWDEFYKTYWRLIHSVARKAGLTEDEAWDVVQETILTIARQSRKKAYNPEAGSFKSWLLTATRWRIADRFQKRERNLATSGDGPDSDRDTATIERFSDPARPALETVWDSEWASHLTEIALRRVRDKVSPKQYQIYDCYVLKDWDVARVAEHIGVSIAQIYVAKHRVGALLRKEITALEKTTL